MAEPVTSTAGAVGAKFAFPVLGTGMAAIIVMALAYPKTRREFIAAMASTLALSLFGGAALIDYFDFNTWGHVAQGLAYFVSGLPAWVLVRAFFSWSEKNKDRDLVELVKEVKNAVKSDD